jgi:hypothetical protein
MFNIYLGIYIIAAILIIAGGSFKVYNSGQIIGTILFFAGAIAVFVIFGIRWFGDASGIFSKTPVSWPPINNTCPDYLVYYGRKMPDGSSQDTCIDTIGVSKNGALKIFPKGKNPSDIPTDNDYYFSLATKSSDPVQRKAELCQRAISFGLTWEGITNGESCVTPAGPVAPSGGGSGGCPAQ